MNPPADQTDEVPEAAGPIPSTRPDSTRMPDLSVGGSGLTEEFRNASWEKFLDEIYDTKGWIARVAADG